MSSLGHLTFELSVLSTPALGEPLLSPILVHITHPPFVLSRIYGILLAKVPIPQCYDCFTRMQQHTVTK